jgi:hypothetical protein
MNTRVAGTNSVGAILAHTLKPLPKDKGLKIVLDIAFISE